MSVITINNAAHIRPETRHSEPGILFSAYLGLRFVARLVAKARVGMQCADEARRLARLSPEALARRGLTRDTAMEHAFAPFLRD